MQPCRKPIIAGKPVSVRSCHFCKLFHIYNFGRNANLRCLRWKVLLKVVHRIHHDELMCVPNCVELLLPETDTLINRCRKWVMIREYQTGFSILRKVQLHSIPDFFLLALVLIWNLRNFNIRTSRMQTTKWASPQVMAKTCQSCNVSLTCDKHIALCSIWRAVVISVLMYQLTPSQMPSLHTSWPIVLPSFTYIHTATWAGFSKMLKPTAGERPGSWMNSSFINKARATGNLNVFEIPLSDRTWHILRI